jgi:hypothetical protein
MDYPQAFIVVTPTLRIQIVATPTGTRPLQDADSAWERHRLGFAPT